ncbi:MAG: GTP cyclohydrolase I FolE [Bdellovibrionaceae bacterium]|nr:GTP cyclohydrolase I FolE [Pseudobdellovibrionaceae bacterium]
MAKTRTTKKRHTADNILARVRPTPMKDNGLSDEEKIASIADKFTDIMNVLGLDLSNDSLRETPRRIAKMYVNEIFSGLKSETFPKMTVIENEMDYDQMVLVQDIQVISVCEHHFQTIDGLATVAYIPNKKVIGLSKINRIVRYFSRRPQVQERLTKQIADCLQYVLGTDHVAVHINARHYCVIARGIEDHHSSTSTSDLRGHFKSRPETRSEFLQHCQTRLRI